MDLIWVHWSGTTMFDGKRTHLEFEMIKLGHLSVQTLTWEIG